MYADTVPSKYPPGVGRSHRPSPGSHAYRYLVVGLHLRRQETDRSIQTSWLFTPGQWTPEKPINRRNGATELDHSSGVHRTVSKHYVLPCWW